MRGLILLVVILWTQDVLLAEEPKPAAVATETKAADNERSSDDKSGKNEGEKFAVIETHHKATIHGQALAYTVKAGKMPIKDAEGKTTAEMFYMAYTKDGVEDLSKRPVTFSFNGGPGASSVWMHLGLLGPRRVKLNDDGTAPPPPYALENNEHSLLDETDLVFIDPVGTGYSRATKPEEAKKFHGVQEDARSVGEFIRLYVTQNLRWPSPKFLIGESYGTTRAAALSSELMNRHRMNLNGIMLVSTVLDFQTIADSPSNDLAHVLFLPSFTAAAWHHGKLPQDLQNLPLSDVLKQSETFASSDYQFALFQGASLPADRRRAALSTMARLTGLDEVYLDRANLRPGLARFSVELLREKHLQIGRFDGRFKGYAQNALTETYERDPSADEVFPVFAAAFNQYVRDELKVEFDEPYEVLARLGPWNWNAENEYLNVADELAQSMMRNPFLKVHVSAGYSDLATPYFAAQHTFNHLKIAPELQQNLTIDFYAAGHMMFLNKPDLIKQKADLAQFIRGALPASDP
jgi:carboxypeptidase C (cathepsin A)